MAEFNDRHFEQIGSARQPVRLVGRADEREVAVALEEVEIGVEVVLGGDGVEDEQELAAGAPAATKSFPSAAS